MRLCREPGGRQSFAIIGTNSLAQHDGSVGRPPYPPAPGGLASPLPARWTRFFCGGALYVRGFQRRSADLYSERYGSVAFEYSAQAFQPCTSILH